MSIEPAYTLIEYLGGAKAVAAMLDKHVSRIYRWSKSEETGGTGGLIPSREQVRLLEHCRITGQNLRPEDFFSEGRLRTLIQSAKNFEAAE